VEASPVPSPPPMPEPELGHALSSPGEPLSIRSALSDVSAAAGAAAVSTLSGTFNAETDRFASSSLPTFVGLVGIAISGYVCHRLLTRFLV
jgi:hypothetical protein